MRVAGGKGRIMRRNRPAAPERPEFACGLKSSGVLRPRSTARRPFRLTDGRQRSSFAGAGRAHLGAGGLEEHQRAQEARPPGQCRFDL